MSQHLERAMLLLQQGRSEMAEVELRQALTLDPNNPHAHAMLGIVLSEREAFDEAAYEANTAVGIAPDWAFTHYVRAKVLYDRDRYDQAAQAIFEAIRLDALNPEQFWLLAAIRFEQRRWQDALDAAEKGLQIDPAHAGCTNLRAMALVMLGRREEAGQTIDTALSRDPDNATTHANQGWTLLHNGDPKRAMEHFREALRLNPNSEWARHGIVEALKAHNFIYRWLLMYFLWIARLSERAQWGVILGAYFGYNIVRNIARKNPELAPFLQPLIVLYIVFALMTWIADPLFNLVLRLHRFGRLALSPQQILASNIIGSLLLVAAICAGVGWWTGRDPWTEGAIVSAGLVFPVVGVFKCHRGWPRNVMITTSSVLVVLGGLIVALAFTGEHFTEQRRVLWALANRGMDLFLLGVIGSQFAINALAGVRPQR